jgi:hypothetical protein
MKIRTISILALLVVSLSSCWKGEDPYILPSAGSAVQQQLVLGENYDKMVYYNVNTRQFLVRELADWDLAFEDGDNGLHVVMNGGKYMRMHVTGETDFAAPYTVDPKNGLIDNPNGDLDSTAVGNWWSTADGVSKNTLYFIDPNINNTTDKDRFIRFQILSADKTGYNIRLGDNNNANPAKDYFIPKNSKYNFSYFNLTTGEVKEDLEPEKGTWDIVFTRYTSMVENQGAFQPYCLTGVLLNRNGVEAWKETDKTFEQIDINYAMSVKLGTNIETIGWDWKSYNQTSGRYTVNPSITYIIKSNSGLFYKMRFIDYYDDKGVKGTPTFDLQRL